MESTSSTPVGTVGSVPWSGPLCLVENIEGCTMKLKMDTVEKLEQIREPLVIVAIVGLYRTGKSYLMNRLANKQSGFTLGNTVQAMTKGIWIWCVAHPTRPDCRLLLMDTEGFEDVTKVDSNNDMMLFLLAALLSSTLVYNSQGAIDQAALKKLHFVAQLANKLKIADSQASVADDEREIPEFFPKFVWAIRDFQLKLEIEGQEVTIDQYLEHSLKTIRGKTESIASYNAIRNCIKAYFPYRKCFGFPLPVSDASLVTKLGGSLSSISDDQLAPAFLAVSKEFCDHIYAKSQPKTIKGEVMNGTKFSHLAKYYIKRISSGGIVCIEDAFTATARAVNRAALSACVAHYIASMSRLELPTKDEKTLSDHDKVVTQQVKIIFRQQIMVGDKNDELEKTFAVAIAAEYKVISERNETLSSEKCRTIMDKQLQQIQAKIHSGAYHCMGGYSDYMKDFGVAIQTYQNTPDKGVQAGAIENEFLAKYSDISRGIMMCNKTLAEANKAQEEKRLAEESLKRDYEELKIRNAKTERQVDEQARRQLEFESSMREKLEEQSCEYKRQISRLIKQLSKEKDRMTRTKEPKEDVDEVVETLQAMQERAHLEALDREASKSYTQRLFSYRLQ